MFYCNPVGTWGLSLLVIFYACRCVIPYIPCQILKYQNGKVFLLELEPAPGWGLVHSFPAGIPGAVQLEDDMVLPAPGLVPDIPGQVLHKPVLPEYIPAVAVAAEGEPGQPAGLELLGGQPGALWILLGKIPANEDLTGCHLRGSN